MANSSEPRSFFLVPFELSVVFHPCHDVNRLCRRGPRIIRAAFARSYIACSCLRFAWSNQHSALGFEHACCVRGQSCLAGRLSSLCYPILQLGVRFPSHHQEALHPRATWSSCSNAHNSCASYAQTIRYHIGSISVGEGRLAAAEAPDFTAWTASSLSGFCVFCVFCAFAAPSPPTPSPAPAASWPGAVALMGRVEWCLKTDSSAERRVVAQREARFSKAIGSPVTNKRFFRSEAQLRCPKTQRERLK